jgi:16S rRNA processing protein RimM
VVVHLWTDQTQRLDPGATLISRGRALHVQSSRPMGGGADRFLVQFEGVSERRAAEELHGAELEAEPLEVPGTLWVHELVGSLVRDATGTSLGRVVSVEANPASDLLVLESGGLIPVRFVTGHDAAGATVDVDIPEGLLEL